METFYQILFYSAVLLAIILMLWGMKEIKSLRTRFYKAQARAESNRRVFNLFLHKLATEREIYDAMNIIAPQICEDLDAESVGIFVPDDRILVETDSPFLAPVPMRGAANEPAFIVHTARFLAGLRNMRYEDFAALTYANGLAAFGLKEGK